MGNRRGECVAHLAICVCARSSELPVLREALEAGSHAHSEKGHSAELSTRRVINNPSAIDAQSRPLFPRPGRAQVGPPCFLDPPTSVGAIRPANAAHASAPSHPSAAISSRSACPTVGGDSFVGDGHRQ